MIQRIKKHLDISVYVSYGTETGLKGACLGEFSVIKNTPKSTHIRTIFFLNPIVAQWVNFFLKTDAVFRFNAPLFNVYPGVPWCINLCLQTNM